MTLKTHLHKGGQQYFEEATVYCDRPHAAFHQDTYGEFALLIAVHPLWLIDGAGDASTAARETAGEKAYRQNLIDAAY